MNFSALAKQVAEPSKALACRAALVETDYEVGTRSARWNGDWAICDACERHDDVVVFVGIEHDMVSRRADAIGICRCRGKDPRGTEKNFAYMPKRGS